MHWRPMPPHTPASVATAQSWPNARAAGGRAKRPQEPRHLAAGCAIPGTLPLSGVLPLVSGGGPVAGQAQDRPSLGPRLLQTPLVALPSRSDRTRP